MAINWISVPLGKSGIRLGSSWGGGGYGGNPAYGLLSLIMVVVFGYVALWLFVAFCLIKGAWRLARRELGVAAFWIILGLVTGWLNVTAAAWWNAQMQESQKRIAEERVTCAQNGGTWDKDSVHCFMKE
jgi:hypothetical protein